MWLTNFNLNLKSHSTPSTYNEEELNTNQKKCNQQMEMKRYAYFRIAMLVMVFISAHAEQEDRSCANKLVPCLNYLNGTRNPPDDCCDPLKSVIKSNPECLCSLITNKGTKQAREAGIDVNEAQQLPARCGQHVNPISCLTDSGPLQQN